MLDSLISQLFQILHCMHIQLTYLYKYIARLRSFDSVHQHPTITFTNILSIFVSLHSHTPLYAFIIIAALSSMGDSARLAGGIHDRINGTPVKKSTIQASVREQKNNIKIRGSFVRAPVDIGATCERKGGQRYLQAERNWKKIFHTRKISELMQKT